jgi:glycosyltransferase involved in cell wall biosynthesis
MNVVAKNILLILNIPPPYGGGEIRSMYLKEHFSANENYLVFAYSRRTNNKSRQGQVGLNNVIWGFYLIARTCFWIVKYRPKIIYLLIPKNFSAFLRAAFMIWICKRFKVKVLGELAGGSFQFLDNGEVQKKIGLYVLNQVDQLRVLGDSVRKHLAQYGIKETIVLDNGIWIPPDSKIAREVIFGRPLNLLYVGALNFSKGLKNLIYAIGMCKHHKLQVHLHILGEWSNTIHEKEIERYIKVNSLEDYVTFHGLITGDGKWKIYERCAVLTHPTYWDGQPLTILEAMGFGLGVITTPVGAIPDTVKDGVNGILLKENKPDILFDAIKTFYEDRNALAKVSKINVQTYKRKYTIESFCLRMQSWFELHQTNYHN